MLNRENKMLSQEVSTLKHAVDVIETKLNKSTEGSKVTIKAI